MTFYMTFIVNSRFWIEVVQINMAFNIAYDCTAETRLEFMTNAREYKIFDLLYIEFIA